MCTCVLVHQYTAFSNTPLNQSVSADRKHIHTPDLTVRNPLQAVSSLQCCSNRYLPCPEYC